MNSALDKGEVK